ncbi:MAG: hypothetical protein HYX48_03670 [Chlamydiales bacterium]|nr:hypothetical protein [Chlamydiales bacterium]
MAVRPKTNLELVLQDPKGTGPLLFSFLDEKALSAVCKAFQVVNHTRKVEAAKQLLMTSRVHTAQVEQDRDRLVGDHEIELVAAGTHLLRLDPEKMIATFSGAEFNRFWALMEPLRAFASINVVYLGRIADRVDALQQGIGGEPAAVQKLRDAVFAEVEGALARESLNARTKRVCRAHLGEEAYARGELTVSTEVILSGTHRSQLEELSIHQGFSAAFIADTRTMQDSFHLNRFMRQEMHCINLRQEEDRNLKIFCSQIPNFPFVEMSNHDAATHRDWLNTHAAELAQITTLNFFRLSMLPPEIEKFPRLTRLYLGKLENHDDRLQGLSKQLAQLKELESLDIRQSAFSRIPDVLGSVSAKVTIEGNVGRVTIPESVARMHCSGILSHWADYNWGIMERGLNMMEPRYNKEVEHFMGMRREDLEEIPFSLWFRDTYSIPYVPHFGYVFGLIMTGVLDWLRPFQLPLIVEILLLAFIGVPVAFPSLFLAVLIGLPTLLLNILLDYTVQPVVTFSRSLLGYSPMVRLPAPPTA